MRLLGLILIVGGLIAAVCQVGAEENLLHNPGFEQGEDGWQTWPRRGEPVFEIDTEVAHSGSNSARLEVDEAGEDGSWCQMIQPEPGRTYEYSLWFRTGDPDKRITFMAEGSATGGGYSGQFGRQNPVSEGTEWTRASGRFRVPSNTGTLNFELWVNLTGADVTTAWFDDLVLEIVPPQVVFDKIAIEVLQPAHRVVRETGQDIVVRILWPAGVQPPRAGEYRLALEQEGAVLARASAVTESPTLVTFPGELLETDGTYTVTCWLRSEGEYARPEPAAVVRVADQTPPPGAVIIDDQGRTLVDGEPFFPLLVSNVIFPEKWAKFKAQGFNTVHTPVTANLDVCGEVMALAEQVDIKVYHEVSNQLRDGCDLGQIERMAQQLRGSPATLGYHAPDEPGATNTPLRCLQKSYNLLRSVDPYHPVGQIYCNAGSLEYYGQTTDILNMDPYFEPAMVAEWTRFPNEWQRMQGLSRGVWSTLRAFPHRQAGMPTPQRVALDTYLALINGAKGIMYFNYDFPPVAPGGPYYHIDESPLWEPFKELNRRTMTFAPVVLEGKKLDIDPGEKSTSQVGMWRYQGQLWILAANCKNEPVTLSFALPDEVASDAVIQVLFEGRNLAGSGEIRDDFVAYGTHAYRIALR